MSTRILSINGNEAMNYLLQTVFKKKFQVITVEDVFDGMQYLKSGHSIKAIIIDIDTQSHQAWQLIEHLKSSKLFQIPITVLASSKNEAIEKKCYDLEISDIVFKPFNPEDLLAMVESSIEELIPNIY